MSMATVIMPMARLWRISADNLKLLNPTLACSGRGGRIDPSDASEPAAEIRDSQPMLRCFFFFAFCRINIAAPGKF